MTEDKIDLGLGVARAFKNETTNPIGQAVADLALEALRELRALQATSAVKMRGMTYGKPLSNRQRQILDLLRGESLTYEQVADRLAISINTVRHHVRALYSKLGARGLGEASAIVAGEAQAE